MLPHCSTCEDKQTNKCMNNNKTNLNAILRTNDGETARLNQIGLRCNASIGNSKSSPGQLIADQHFKRFLQLQEVGFRLNILKNTIGTKLPQNTQILVIGLERWSSKQSASDLDCRLTSFRRTELQSWLLRPRRPS